MVEMDSGRYHQPDKLQDETKPTCMNLMRGGIVYSNFVTAVSPAYADEMREPVGGRGLHNVLNAFGDRFGGVLNGLDYRAWDPATDPKLAARYSAGDDFIEKYRNKYALREWLNLRDEWMPIVSYVGRLTPQKGLDLIRRAIYATLERGGQFVLLGSSPDPRVNADFWRIKNELAESRDVHLWLGYHEDLAHLVYAGSDLLVVPSLYEPCGLTQMIALRYGTVPVVRKTGGLADTVFDTEHSERPFGETNGFVFEDPTPEGLEWALGRALSCWYEAPETFNRLAQQSMGFDYSWRGAGQHYENIYNHIRAK
jgi:starch synthase